MLTHTHNLKLCYEEKNKNSFGSPNMLFDIQLHLIKYAQTHRYTHAHTHTLRRKERFVFVYDVTLMRK